MTTNDRVTTADSALAGGFAEDLDGIEKRSEIRKIQLNVCSLVILVLLTAEETNKQLQEFVRSSVSAQGEIITAFRGGAQYRIHCWQSVVAF